ncbi:MAG: RNA polymerase sigma factor [Spirochaetes bacterium]|nr:RNA polymerase sigma factor [Spirochaetota bacterium]
MNFAHIIAETKRPVLAAVRRYLDGRFAYAIDDVVQEVYLRAYRALAKGKLRDDTKLRSYLYTIARNEALRMNESGVREEAKAEKFLAAEKIRLAEIAPQQPTAAELTAEILEQLKFLPQHYASVVELTLAGYSAAEIVERLAIKPGTVKSRLSRGLALLRERMV